MAEQNSAQQVSEMFDKALLRDFGGQDFVNPEGWRFLGARPRTFRQTVAVASFAREATTLCFIVTPTNIDEKCYRRTEHFDITYFSEDVPDEQQSIIYSRDRTMIDRFVAWCTLVDKKGLL